MTIVSREEELRQQLVAAAVSDAQISRFLDAILASPVLDAIAAQIGKASGLPIADFADLLNADDMAVTPIVADGAFGLDLGLPAALSLDLSGFHVGGLGIALTYKPGAGEAPGEAFGALRGAMRAGSVVIPVEAALSVAGAAAIALTIPSAPLAAIIEEIVGEALPPEVPNFTLENVALTADPAAGTFSLAGMAASPWELPIGLDGIVIREVAVALSRAAGEDGAMAVAGSISGALGLGPATLAVSYEFPGALEIGGELPSLGVSPLVQALCGTGIVQDLPAPASVLAVELTDLSVKIIPQQRMLSCSGSSALGTAEVAVARTSAGTWGFNVGFAPPSSWKFSAIDSALTPLDALKLDGTTMVIASSDDRSLELAAIKLPREDVAVSRGLNFFAGLDVSGTGVDEITGLKTLSIYAAIGPDPAAIVLEAEIGGRFELGQGVVFGGVRFRLVPSPTNFSVTLLGTVEAVIDTSVLTFTGGMQVTPMSAALQATMAGMWQSPFGVRGVAVGNVALDLGVGFGPLRPSVGIAGSLQVGDFAGAAALRVDTIVPSKSMLAVAFNRLFLMDVIRTFCGPTVTAQIPQQVADKVLNIGMEDVELYIVPQETRIGELVYEQGLRAKGKMTIAGLNARGAIKFDYLEGLELDAEVDPFAIGGVFRLTGARGYPRAAAHVRVSPLSAPVVDINGAVELLGLRSETIIQLSERGFFFLTEGRIFDTFSASLEVSGTDLTAGGSYYVRATMRNDLTSYLRDEAAKAIKAAADDAARKIGEAQARVAAAQREVDRITAEIERQRSIVRAERDRDSARVREAQAQVDAAQREVNRINAEIERQRAIVRAERERDAERLRDAQNAVARAQADVDGYQAQINQRKARIDQISRELDARARWYDNLGRWDKVKEWPGYKAWQVAKRGEQGTLYAEIGKLEGEKNIKVGVLEGVRATLRGLGSAANRAPVDADPRVAGLFAGRESANAGLTIAQRGLQAAQAAIKTFPVDADPRVAGLFAGREAATAGLQGANLALEGVRRAVGPMAGFADEVARYSLGGLLDVKAASFEGSLALASGGAVQLSVTVALMGRPQQTVALAFSFADPLSAARSLARQLMPA
jgi:hypothetical protein